MKFVGNLTAYGYGFMAFSTDLFNEYTKTNKWKAKKFLTYFQKDMNKFFQIIKDGILAPFYKIPVFNYDIFVKINQNDNEIPEGYKKVFEKTGFYMEIGKNICFANFEFMDTGIDLIKQDITENFITAVQPDNSEEKQNMVLGFEMEKGKYCFNLIGLEKANKNKYETYNYGYLFEFTKDENAVNDNINKCDDEKNVFSIIKHKE